MFANNIRLEIQKKKLVLHLFLGIGRVVLDKG